ncbi:hypothetical protein TDB9533_03016 [Thalassocella blandensis]|nr:hypothetical protein TDB9533_03016 [Thalassocella blandensis]
MWFHSFSSLEERYLAAIVLDSLAFRSADQTKALMIQGLQRCIPQLLMNNDYFDKYRGRWLETLSKSSVPIRLVPVLRNGDGPGKSGHVVCREYSRLVGVNNKLIINPQDISAAKADGVKLIVFVDDFLGTGQQFSKFYAQVRGEFDESLTPVYIPLCAHETGMYKVRGDFPELYLSAPESLSVCDGLFGEDHEVCPDGVNTYSSLKDLYIELMRTRLGMDIDEPFGYGGLGMVYGFSHATPNATLPLLWSKKNGNICLLNRS